jgi:hypothetical protein
MVNSRFVTEEEMNSMIDVATGDLYDVLVEAFGDEYFGKICWLNVDNAGRTGNNIAWPNPTYRLSESNGVVVISGAPTPEGGLYSAYPMPFDFMRLLRAEFIEGTPSQAFITIPHADPTPDEVVDSNNWVISNMSRKRSTPMYRLEMTGGTLDQEPQAWTDGSVGYRLRHGPHRIIVGSTMETGFSWPHNGAMIEFLPIPTGNYAVCLTYVPKPALLSDNTTDFAYDYVEFVAYTVAARCIDKQEGDSKMWHGMAAQVEARIKGRARTPDAANPPQVVMHARDWRGTIPYVRKGDGFPWR